jgi:hypothetical protein
MLRLTLPGHALWWSFVLGAMVAHGLACAAPQTVTGTAGLPSTNPYPDRQTLLADPASTIRMPGADELRPVGAERRTTPEGYATAFDGGIFGVHAAPAEVQAFYDAELRRQAWQPDTYQVFPTSTDLKVWGWCKPERLFRVAILDPSFFSPSLTQGQSYEALFHATINGRTPAVPCPAQ